jgi:hypothetical protein
LPFATSAKPDTLNALWCPSGHRQALDGNKPTPEAPACALWPEIASCAP